MNEFNFSTGVFPHEEVRVVVAGEEIKPRTAVIILHGRGSSSESILSALDMEGVATDAVIYAPQATNKVWFPLPFYESLQQNEPHVGSALKLVDALIEKIQKDYGLAGNDIVLAGFSQGASLVCQYLITRPKQYKGACIWSGGLMGSGAEILSYPENSSLLQTPIYYGCDEADPHVPLSRLRQTKNTLEKFGGNINYKEYKNLRHAIHEDGKKFLHFLSHSR